MNIAEQRLRSYLLNTSELDYSDIHDQLDALLKLRVKWAKFAINEIDQSDVSVNAYLYINRQIIALLGVYLPELESTAKIYPDLERYAKMEREEKL